MLLHRVPSPGPEETREPQAAREREAVLAHSADPPVNSKSLWKRRS
jgi:hypothetical protein